MNRLSAADEQHVRVHTRAQQRTLGASEEEEEAAAVAVVNALRHLILRRAARVASAGELRRETPVMLRTGDRPLVEGQVDLAFRENGGNQARWTVVNFKTDRELGTREARSQEQVRLYARAIGSATGEAAEGVLLLV